MANQKRSANDDQISDDAAIKCKAMLIECIDINKQEQQELYDSGLNIGSTLEKDSDSQSVDVPVKLSSSHKTLVKSPLRVWQKRALIYPENGRPYDYKPIQIVDFQRFLIFTLMKGIKCLKPYHLDIMHPGHVDQVMLIVLNGVSYSEVQCHEKSFPFLTSTEYFSRSCDCHPEWPTVGDSTRTDQKSPTCDVRRKPYFGYQPAGDSGQNANATKQNMCTKGELLLSSKQMLADDYCLPFDRNGKEILRPGFVYTRDLNGGELYSAVTEDSPIYAVDCEMVETDADVKERKELARIAIVDQNGNTFYHSFVRPKNRIVDYITHKSGITPELLSDVTTYLGDVQSLLQSRLPSNTILCGHSLNFDLAALKMFHPYVIDTSVIYNMSGKRHFKPKLKTLAKFHLRRDIQIGNFVGHSPIEDSVATMDLVNLKRKFGKAYGDMAFINHDIYPSTPDIEYPGVVASYFNLFQILKCSREPMTCHVIGPDDLVKDYRGMSHVKVVGVENVVSAVNTVKQDANDDRFVCLFLSDTSSDKSSAVKVDEDVHKKKAYRSVDQHLEDLVSGITSTTVVAVVFPGHREDGAVFFHTTGIHGFPHAGAS